MKAASFPHPVPFLSVGSYFCSYSQSTSGDITCLWLFSKVTSASPKAAASRKSLPFLESSLHLVPPHHHPQHLIITEPQPIAICLVKVLLHLSCLKQYPQGLLRSWPLPWRTASLSACPWLPSHRCLFHRHKHCHCLAEILACSSDFISDLQKMCENGSRWCEHGWKVRIKPRKSAEIQGWVPVLQPFCIPFWDTKGLHSECSSQLEHRNKRVVGKQLRRRPQLCFGTFPGEEDMPGWVREARERQSS